MKTKRIAFFLLGLGLTVALSNGICAEAESQADVLKLSGDNASSVNAANTAAAQTTSLKEATPEEKIIPAASDSMKADVLASDAATIKEETPLPEVKAKDLAPAPDLSSPQEVKTLPTVVSAEADEMKKNWDALFSKEMTPDSVLYTVKAGDSLYVLAKKYGTTIDLIKKMNGLGSDDLFPNMKLKIYKAPFSIEVSKASNTLVLYANRKPVKKYSVATGKNNSTPEGTFKISNKLVNPTWFKTGAVFPPGSPENELGSRWMGFDRTEYGIHGTLEPQSIGSQASAGCVRMLNADVEELYSMVPSGTQVTVKD